MKADWKDASKELPERRIRVLTCDSFGYMQTAFYGLPTNPKLADHIGKEAWFHDEVNNEYVIEVIWWDDFPETPIKQRGPFDYKS